MKKGIHSSFPILSELWVRISHMSFTQPYYQTLARFVAKKSFPVADATPATLAGKSIGIVAGSAHEAYLATFFPGSRANPTPISRRCATPCAPARSKRSSATASPSRSGWQANLARAARSRAARSVESRFFGEGIGIAVRKEDSSTTRDRLGAREMAERGVYGEIYRKYFPIGFY